MAKGADGAMAPIFAKSLDFRKRYKSFKIYRKSFELAHMKLTAVKCYCSDLGNPPQRAFAIRTSMNRVIFFIYSES